MKSKLRFLGILATGLLALMLAGRSSQNRPRAKARVKSVSHLLTNGLSGRGPENSYGKPA